MLLPLLSILTHLFGPFNTFCHWEVLHCWCLQPTFEMLQKESLELWKCIFFFHKNSPRFCWVMNFENSNFSSVLSSFSWKKLVMYFQTNWYWLFLCPKASLQSRAGSAGRGSSRPMGGTSSSHPDRASKLGQQGWAGVASAAPSPFQVWQPALAGQDVVETWEETLGFLNPPLSSCPWVCEPLSQEPRGVTAPRQRWWQCQESVCPR